MKYLPLNELEVGKLYLFHRYFNSKRIILQPGRVLGIHSPSGDLAQFPGGVLPRPRPMIEWSLDRVQTTAPAGGGKKTAAVLTKAWLQRNMLDRADQIRDLQAESSAMFNLLKEV